MKQEFGFRLLCWCGYLSGGVCLAGRVKCVNGWGAVWWGVGWEVLVEDVGAVWVIAMLTMAGDQQS